MSPIAIPATSPLASLEMPVVFSRKDLRIAPMNFGTGAACSNSFGVS